jgi:hypothetical protein
VLGGPDADRLTAVAKAPRSGFETALSVPAGDRSFEVQALDAHGRVIGTSAPFVSRGA